jgi:hypothetical protein
MRKPKNFSNHQCAPAEWRGTPDMTGSYEMDAMIMKTSNRDMIDRLKTHLTGDAAYERRTAYNGSTID